MAGDGWFFDRFAPLYDRLMPAADADALATGLAAADRPVERVLDLAGGTGRGASALSGVEPLVVDVSRPMARRAAARGFPTLLGDAARLPLADASVDAAVVVDAFHHLPDQRGALREVARVLRPGGVVVVQEFDPGTVRGGAIDLAERLVRFGSTFHRREELAGLLAAADLTVEPVTGGWSYVLAGRKER